MSLSRVARKSHSCARQTFRRASRRRASPVPSDTSTNLNEPFAGYWGQQKRCQQRRRLLNPTQARLFSAEDDSPLADSVGGPNNSAIAKTLSENSGEQDVESKNILNNLCATSDQRCYSSTVGSSSSFGARKDVINLGSFRLGEDS